MHLNKIHPSIILPHSSPLLRTISTGFIILFSYTYTNYIDHIYPPSPFSFNKICFTFLSLNFLSLYWLFKGVHLSISHMNTLYFNQINPAITYSFSVALLPYYLTAFSTFHDTIIICRCNVISILFTLYPSLFLSHFSIVHYKRYLNCICWKALSSHLGSQLIEKRENLGISALALVSIFVLCHSLCSHFAVALDSRKDRIDHIFVSRNWK
jgi:hypothetical protein